MSFPHHSYGKPVVNQSFSTIPQVFHIKRAPWRVIFHIPAEKSPQDMEKEEDSSNEVPDLEKSVAIEVRMPSCPAWATLFRPCRNMNICP